MNKKTTTIIALSLVVAGGGIAFGVSTNKKAAQKIADLEMQLAEQPDLLSQLNITPEPLAPLGGAGVDSNLLAKLQEQLLALEKENEELRQQQEARSARRTNSQQSRTDRMAQLKEEDPERYAEIQQRRTEMQDRMRNTQYNRISTLAEVDTSNMTPEQLANHNALIEKLSEIYDATAQFDPENPPDRETMQAAMSTMREVGDMMETERSTILTQLGSDVGLSGSEASEFASYVQSVIDSTSVMGGGGMRGGPPGGGGR